MVTWDVGKVFKFLAAWHPHSGLSLKQLTLKTVSLIALTSSDRAQTIHALDIHNLNYVAQGLEFNIPSILKHSRKGRPSRRVLCVEWDAPELNVCKYVEAYIAKTFKFRLKAVNMGKEKPHLFLKFNLKGSQHKAGNIK